MSRRIGLGLAAVVLLVFVGAVGWYLASPLFIDETVDEAFPLAIPDAASLAAMPDPERDALETELMATAAAMPDHVMAESMPGADAALRLSQGQFQGADSFHQGSGQAIIYRLADGSRVLRLEEFQVTNGPDLHVLLSRSPAPADRADVGEDYVDLGSLKGNLGNQNYDIPAGVDLANYRSVVIYCLPFHVVFAKATLAN